MYPHTRQKKNAQKPTPAQPTNTPPTTQEIAAIIQPTAGTATYTSQQTATPNPPNGTQPLTEDTAHHGRHKLPRMARTASPHQSAYNAPHGQTQPPAILSTPSLRLRPPPIKCSACVTGKLFTKAHKRKDHHYKKGASISSDIAGPISPHHEPTTNTL